MEIVYLHYIHAITMSYVTLLYNNNNVVATMLYVHSVLFTITSNMCEIKILLPVGLFVLTLISSAASIKWCTQCGKPLPTNSKL